MAAPSGIVWGSTTSNGRGRIGIYVSLTNTNTQTTAKVQVWVKTQYNCYDNNNNLYYNVGTSITAATTSVGSKSFSHSSGTSWSTSNETMIHSATYTYTRGTSAVTYKVYAKFSNVDWVDADMLANTSFTVPAKPTYTVSYNANGGSGAPSAQTKTYGTALTLSSTKPTRTGYTFRGWSTSAGGAVVYAAGASYTANASVTLYAVWQAVTYAVTYNANGGVGAPATQTKTYGQTLVLSMTTPSRANYTFLGWSTSSTATSATYVAGGTYTANAAVTLYAVWQLTYTKPKISSYSATRCDSNGSANSSGVYARLKFAWSTFNNVSSVTVSWVASTGTTGSATITASGKSGTVDQTITSTQFAANASYTFTITVTDSGGSASVKTPMGGNIFPIDCLSGGYGVAFGKAATKQNAVESDWDTYLNKDVYVGDALETGGAITAGGIIYDRFDRPVANGMSEYTSAGIDPNATTDHLILTNHTNGPSGSGVFYYITTVFYGSKSTSSYRAQYAMPYNTTNSIYFRRYTDKGWSTWRRIKNADESVEALWTGSWSTGTISVPKIANYKSFLIELQSINIPIPAAKIGSNIRGGTFFTTLNSSNAVGSTYLYDVAITLSGTTLSSYTSARRSCSSAGAFTNVATKDPIVAIYGVV